MNLDNNTKKTACPFCASELTKERARCNQCGAERVVNYINPEERRLILILRMALGVVSVLVFWLTLALVGNPAVSLVGLLAAITLSWLAPMLYFKRKKRGNVAWVKKPMIW